MLNLTTLKSQKRDGVLTFQQELDLSFVALWEEHPFSQPVVVSGTVSPLMEEDYKIEYCASYTSVLPCARCLSKVERKFSPSFSHLLKETGEEPFTEDGYVPISKGKLDLTTMVVTDLLLEMEEKPLCKPDCLGLCPICGGDRNKQQCDCKSEEFVDPRFDVLRELLGK